MGHTFPIFLLRRAGVRTGGSAPGHLLVPEAGCEDRAGPQSPALSYLAASATPGVACGGRTNCLAGMWLIWDRNPAGRSGLGTDERTGRPPPSREGAPWPRRRPKSQLSSPQTQNVSHEAGTFTWPVYTQVEYQVFELERRGSAADCMSVSPRNSNAETQLLM